MTINETKERRSQLFTQAEPGLQPVLRQRDTLLTQSKNVIIISMPEDDFNGTKLKEAYYTQL